MICDYKHTIPASAEEGY